MKDIGKRGGQSSQASWCVRRDNTGGGSASCCQSTPSLSRAAVTNSCPALSPVINCLSPSPPHAARHADNVWDAIRPPPCCSGDKAGGTRMCLFSIETKRASTDGRMRPRQRCGELPVDSAVTARGLG